MSSKPPRQRLRSKRHRLPRQNKAGVFNKTYLYSINQKYIPEPVCSHGYSSVFQSDNGTIAPKHRRAMRHDRYVRSYRDDNRVILSPSNSL